MKLSAVQDACDRPGGADAIAPGLLSPRMHPVAFTNCFGWLHQSPRSAGSDTCVLLCTGLGRDANKAHRSFRRLADHLADAGYPALRFDYPGTGDAPPAAAPHLWAAWQRSVPAAIDWLRQHTGASRVAIVGLRFGAILALPAAATRDDIAALALLDPIARGKSYLSQLIVEARLRNQPAPDPDGFLEFDGIHLDPETIDAWRQLDLRHLPPPLHGAVAVFNQLPNPVLDTALETWRSHGLSVTSGDPTGLAPLFRPCHVTDPPDLDAEALLVWLRTHAAPRRTQGLGGQSEPPAVTLSPPGCIETPLRFGEHRHLFGMLCRPENDAPPDLAVIIGNSGGDPHHGYAQFAVETARFLANNGIASLRMDFAGLGDSCCPGDDGLTQIFSADRTPDFAAGIDALQRLGYRRFALHGLCSGAYHALLATQEDQRVDLLLPVNLPWFSLRHDRPGPSSIARQAMAGLAHRDVRTLLLFAAGDPGVKELERHFGPDGTELQAVSPGATATIIPGLDHDLTTRAMRQTVLRPMLAFLLQQPAPPPGDTPTHDTPPRDPTPPELVS